MAKRDYYEVLGVARNAAQEEIRKAHRRLVRQYHPDVNKNDKGAEAKFRKVQEAYDILSDESKRQNYDQFGHAGVGTDSGAGARPGGAGADPFDAFRQAAQQGRGGRGAGRTWSPGAANPNVTVEDFDAGEGGFSDIFEQMFGARGGRGARSEPRGRTARPERGQDIEYPFTLTFAQAARGTKLPLQINRDGKLETIEVQIPAGVKDVSRIRIKGRGQQAGGEPGDLYIVTKVLDHPYFRREGLDIHLTLPLSLYEALLGTKVEVPTLDGPVTLTIPPGTSGGTKLRIAGRGVERGNEKGDQIVVTKIVVPKSLDAEAKELIKTMSEKYPVNARADLKW